MVLPRVLLKVGAAVFLLAMAGYSAASIYYNPRRFPPATLGAATGYLAADDETTSRLRYANCGHPPPVLLGSDGAIDRLLPTGTVIGLFDEWDCRIQEIDLKPGDTLVMFTDGVAEAFDADFEEFGEERIVDLYGRGPIARP